MNAFNIGDRVRVTNQDVAGNIILIGTTLKGETVYRVEYDDIGRREWCVVGALSILGPV